MHNKSSHIKYLHTLQLVILSTIQQETLASITISLHLRLYITETKHSITPTDKHNISIFPRHYSSKTLLTVSRTSCALSSYQMKALACLRALDFQDFGFESRRRHGCLSLVIVVCCAGRGLC